MAVTHQPGMDRLRISVPDRDRATLVRTQSTADELARELRQRHANALAGPFVASYDQVVAAAAVAQSPFADFALTYRHKSPTLTLAFNLAVTDAAVEELCEQVLDPVMLLAAVSRTVELGAHSIFDPHAPDNRPDVFLAAAKTVGYFFTPPDICFELARSALPPEGNIDHVLDPAAGAGALLAAVMVEAATRGSKVGEITAIELDPFASRICLMLLSRVRHLTGLECTLDVRNADAIDWLFGHFGGHLDGVRYGCIVMNPPYGRVKFLRDMLTNAETSLRARPDELDRLEVTNKERAKAQARRYRQMSQQIGIGGGAQDYQRLFAGLTLSLLAPKGRMAMISSDGWLGDAAAGELRRKIVREGLLEQVTLYPETSGLFATVNQPTAVATFSRVPKSGFGVRTMIGPSRQVAEEYLVTYDAIVTLDPERMRVPRVSPELHDVYVRLANCGRLGRMTGLRNARGELDVTLHRSLIQSEVSELPLVRGDHVERFVLRAPEESDKPSYVNVEAFVERFASAPKYGDTQSWRLVGNQCAYQNKPRRLTFALVPPGVVVSNSCNYIAATGHRDEAPDEVLDALLVLVNSAPAEFFFNLFNSNNHVANYELDELPVPPAGHPVWGTLAALGRYLRIAFGQLHAVPRNGSLLEDLADAVVAGALGLAADQMAALMSSVDPARAKKVVGLCRFLEEEGTPAKLLSGQGWFNHIPPGLSDLDREIIRHVPQGGNWQDIPESVPSARLAQIREMTAARGVVRTTYYGRLRPDQPAYTIATYYNRPGNGTNIHPWAERTLTSREAARLQSFPDWYIFTGSEAAVRKQIGNAVPPLLGYAVGRHLLELGFDGQWVELFAGAGGLSLGLEEAGCNVAVAVDNNRDAVRTYRLNRDAERDPDPRSGRTLVLDADLSSSGGELAVRDAIEAKLGGARLSALVGGPPCQGFSHAGWRSAADERNDLAMAFMRFVKHLEPELVLLENVEGLLTYDNGRVIRELTSTLRELGYMTQALPWVLRAETFGVPQMRRRVFLVASRRDEVVPAPSPCFQVCKGRRESGEMLLMEEDLPYPVTVAEALQGLPLLGDASHTSLGTRPIRAAYGAWLRGEISVGGLLSSYC